MAHDPSFQDWEPVVLRKTRPTKSKTTVAEAARKGEVEVVKKCRVSVLGVLTA